MPITSSSMDKKVSLAALLPGDAVYIYRHYGFDSTSWMLGEVTKITPTGFIDVKIGTANPRRYDQNGREKGERYSAYTIDTEMTVDERKAYLVRKELLWKNNREIAEILLDHQHGRRAEKEILLAEVNSAIERLTVIKSNLEAL